MYIQLLVHCVTIYIFNEEFFSFTDFIQHFVFKMYCAILLFFICCSLGLSVLANNNGVMVDEFFDEWGSTDVKDVKEEDKVIRWTRDGICDHDPMTAVLLRFILDIQHHMKRGHAKKRIPKLDPFNISKLNFDVVRKKKPKYKIEMELMNIIAEGMSIFNILDIQSDVMGMEANISLQFDALRVFGDYLMRGKIASIIPVFGNGQFFLHPEQAKVDVFTKLGTHDGPLELTYFDFNINLTDIFVNFDGIFGAGRTLSKGFNKIFNSFGLKVFNILESKIHDKVRDRIINEINMKLLELKYDEPFVKEMLEIMPIQCMFG